MVGREVHWKLGEDTDVWLRRRALELSPGS